jgi:hypothetical protein
MVDDANMSKIMGYTSIATSSSRMATLNGQTPKALISHTVPKADRTRSSCRALLWGSRTAEWCYYLLAEHGAG